MKALTSIILALSFLFTFNAQAAEPEVKEIIITDADTIDGELSQSRYAPVSVLEDTHLPSLIEVRSSFVDKLLVEVDNLK